MQIKVNRTNVFAKLYYNWDIKHEYYSARILWFLWPDATTCQLPDYANNNVQIGSTTSIKQECFYRSSSLSWVSYLALQSTLFSQSVPHKQSSVQVKLCLLHEHLWVVQWALHWHLISSNMACGADGTCGGGGQYIAMVIPMITMFEWVQQMLPHHCGLGPQPVRVHVQYAPQGNLL